MKSIKLFQIALVVSFICIADFNVEWAKADLVAHYTFDDGTFNEYVGGFNGAGAGNATVVDDPERGMVLSLDGIGDYVDIPTTAGAVNEFTIAMWIYSRVDLSSVQFAGGLNTDAWSPQGVHLKLNYGKVNVGIQGGAGDAVGTTMIPVNTWAHIAVTLEANGDYKVYYNGEEEGSQSPGAPLTVNLFAANIGSYNASRYLNGMIDDVRIYNHALTEEEIKNIMEDSEVVNQPPSVDAGIDRVLILTNQTVTLDATVEDDGLPLPNSDPPLPNDPNQLFMAWSLSSGPDGVTFEDLIFDPNECVEDPLVTFPAILGSYILQLYATDGDKYDTDTVTITLDEAFCPPGDMNGDCITDLLDLKLLLEKWTNYPDLENADLNGDLRVNMYDYNTMANNWLRKKSRLMINEFLARNQTIEPPDPQNQYDDWIELYNAGDEPIDVGGMYLTDDLDAPLSQWWQFPTNQTEQTMIQPHDYLLIWADADIYDTPGLHANFDLEADEGEEIGLFDTDGLSLIDSIHFGKQYTDISYGRYPNGGSEWRFFGTPTPEALNDGAYLGVVADTTFSTDRGFYNTPFDVALTTTTESATIYYTLDGSAPIDENDNPTATSLKYSIPIPITKTSCLKAAAVKPGWKSTNIDAQTYIFIEDVIRQDYQATLNAGFPTSWNGVSPDYGMDPDVIGTFDSGGNPNGDDLFGGIYAATIRDDLLSIPTLSIVMNIDDMFGASGIYSNPTAEGIAWERHASVELMYPDGSDGFQVNCGIRIQGGAFRSFGLTKKKSFRLLFKGIYGPTSLEFPIFGKDAADQFDTITLRAGANDGYSWSSAYLTEQYTRDEFGRNLQVATGNAGSHGMFVHLYINGIYWGLYNPCERPDDSFSSSYFGNEKENWDSVHDGVATDGDLIAWNLMRTKAQAAASSNASYMELQGKNLDGTPNPAYPHLLDVPNYIDYLIVNLWGGNWDWPWKNWWAGRDRSDDSTGFKFYCWDFENTMGNNLGRSPLDKNALNNSFSGASNAGDPHYYLKNNTEYRMQFADHVHRHFFNGGILTPTSLIARYTELAAGAERSIVGESTRWGDQHYSTPLTLEEWYDADLNYNDGAAGRDWILNYYLPQRTDIVLQQFRDVNLYPDLDAPIFNINGSYQHGGYVENNAMFSLTLTQTQPQTYDDKIYVDEYVPV